MGVSFTTQLMGAARSAAATIVLAGGRTALSIDRAVDFVERFSGLDFTSEQFVDDLIAPSLSIRLRGDLMLVAESLTAAGSADFVAGMSKLAETCDDANAAHAAVDRCRELLGRTPAERTSWWRTRR